MEAQKRWEPSPNNQSWRPNLDYYPETRSLLSGDILFVSANSAGRRFPRRSARHFKILIHPCRDLHRIRTRDEICEALTSDGVVLSSLEDLRSGESCILARRVPNLFAVMTRSQPYRYRSRQTPVANPLCFPPDLSAGLESIRQEQPLATDAAPRRGVICSTLCEHAILEATQGRAYSASAEPR